MCSKHALIKNCVPDKNYRVNPLNKLAKDGENTVLTHKSLSIDTGRRTVSVGGVGIELTRTEFDLLKYLVSNKGMVLSRNQIMKQVWGYDYIGVTNVIDVYIRYLRTKLDEKFNTKFIHTIRGVGYIVE